MWCIFVHSREFTKTHENPRENHCFHGVRYPNSKPLRPQISPKPASGGVLGPEKRTSHPGTPPKTFPGPLGTPPGPPQDPPGRPHERPKALPGPCSTPLRTLPGPSEPPGMPPGALWDTPGSVPGGNRAPSWTPMDSAGAVRASPRPARDPPRPLKLLISGPRTDSKMGSTWGLQMWHRNGVPKG